MFEKLFKGRKVEEVVGQINEQFNQIPHLVKTYKVDNSLNSRLNIAVQKINNGAKHVDLAVLEYLSDLFLQIRQNPNEMGVYCNAIENIVEDYIVKAKTYNEKDLNTFTKDTDLAVNRAKAYAEAVDTQKRMQDITDEVIDKNIRQDSLEFQFYTTNYNNLQTKLDKTVSTIDAIEKVTSRNASMDSLISKNADYDLLATYAHMTLSEATKLREVIDDKEQQVQDEDEAFDDIFSCLKTERVMPDSTALQKSIEKTLLERMHDEAPTQEEYYEAVDKQEEPEIRAALNELASKLDQLIESGTKDKEEISKLAKLYEDVYSNVYASRDTEGDIEKEIQYLLASNPKDLQSASLKIRSYIERYCKYVKGIDLNDQLLFKQNTAVKDKLAAAGIPDADIEVLTRSYQAANPYIHYAIEEIEQYDDNQREQDIIKALEILKKLCGTKIDYKAGIARLYENEDKIIRNYLKSSNNPTKEVELDSKVTYKRLLNSKLYFAIKNQMKRKEYLKKHEVQVPRVTFEQSDEQKFITALINFANSVNKNKVGQQNNVVKNKPTVVKEDN